MFIPNLVKRIISLFTICPPNNKQIYFFDLSMASDSSSDSSVEETYPLQPSLGDSLGRTKRFSKTSPHLAEFVDFFDIPEGPPESQAAVLNAFRSASLMTKAASKHLAAVKSLFGLAPDEPVETFITQYLLQDADITSTVTDFASLNPAIITFWTKRLGGEAAEIPDMVTFLESTAKSQRKHARPIDDDPSPASKLTAPREQDENHVIGVIPGLSGAQEQLMIPLRWRSLVSLVWPLELLPGNVVVIFDSVFNIFGVFQILFDEEGPFSRDAIAGRNRAYKCPHVPAWGLTQAGLNFINISGDVEQLVEQVPVPETKASLFGQPPEPQASSRGPSVQSPAESPTLATPAASAAVFAIGAQAPLGPDKDPGISPTSVTDLRNLSLSAALSELTEMPSQASKDRRARIQPFLNLTGASNSERPLRLLTKSLNIDHACLVGHVRAEVDFSFHSIPALSILAIPFLLNFAFAMIFDANPKLSGGLHLEHFVPGGSGSSIRSISMLARCIETIGVVGDSLFVTPSPSGVRTSFLATLLAPMISRLRLTEGETGLAKFPHDFLTYLVSSALTRCSRVVSDPRAESEWSRDQLVESMRVALAIPARNVCAAELTVWSLDRPLSHSPFLSLRPFGLGSFKDPALAPRANPLSILTSQHPFPGRPPRVCAMPSY